MVALKKSSLGLKFTGILSIISLICCLVLLILNFRFLAKSRQSVFSHLLRFVAMISIFCGIIIGLWYSFAFSNWFNLNDSCVLFSTLLNDYCDIGWRITFVNVIIQIYAFIIFIVNQIRNLSTHLPCEYQMKSKLYTLLLTILIFVPVVFCLYIMYDQQTLNVGLVYAIDNIKYKYCFALELKHLKRFIFFTWSFMIITIICILIFGIKLYKSIKPILCDMNISEFNKKEIKRVLYDIVAFIITLALLYIVSFLVRAIVFPQFVSIVVSVIITCNLHRNYQHDIRETNQFIYVNQQLQLTMVTTNVNSNSVNTINSNSTTIDALDIDSTCDLVYKYQNGLQFIVPNEFLNDAKRIFTILNDLFYMKFGSGIYHILQDIAAFAATQYEPCMDCGTNLPLIECDKDYSMDFGVVSMLDQYQNTRYYINQDNNSGIEVLCRFCATKRGVLSSFMLLPTLSRTFQMLRTAKQ